MCLSVISHGTTVSGPISVRRHGLVSLWSNGVTVRVIGGDGRVYADSKIGGRLAKDRTTRPGPRGTLTKHCRIIPTVGVTVLCRVTAGHGDRAVPAIAEAEKRRPNQAGSRSEVGRYEAGPIRAVDGRALAASSPRRCMDRREDGLRAKKVEAVIGPHGSRPNLAH